ncbi:MAG TPA: hypothetical protein VGP62_20345 [Bryobacteraceae bacterium]|nr:hypothetical protein [Bryobacteraceae bacterium]
MRVTPIDLRLIWKLMPPGILRNAGFERTLYRVPAQVVRAIVQTKIQ